MSVNDSINCLFSIDLTRHTNLFKNILDEPEVNNNIDCYSDEEYVSSSLSTFQIIWLRTERLERKHIL